VAPTDEDLVRIESEMSGSGLEVHDHVADPKAFSDYCSRMQFATDYHGDAGGSGMLRRDLVDGLGHDGIPELSVLQPSKHAAFSDPGSLQPAIDGAVRPSWNWHRADASTLA
jgi:hypothetical protein